jgi:hypothetical protein
MVARNQRFQINLHPQFFGTIVINMKAFFMSRRYLFIIISIFCSLSSFGIALAGDGFEGLKCGADLSQSLRGLRISNEPVAAIEGRHRDLGLKDLGASEISDNLSAVSWLICGEEYLLLEDSRGLVRDVLLFPAHSKSSPAFSGLCQVKGREQPGVIVAVLDNSTGLANTSGPKALLPAKAAWTIDEKSAKFVKTPMEGLQCPRSGISTVDGGL